MIKFTKYYRNDLPFGFTCEGHANSAPYGEDLVCAAVSAVCGGTFYNLLHNKTIHDGLYYVGKGLIKYLPEDKTCFGDTTKLELLFDQMVYIKNSKHNDDYIVIEEVRE